MALPDDYLAYPHRRRGPDHARYDAQPRPGRMPLVLPEGAALGLWVTVLIEFFPLNPSGVPFKAPGAMQTPYPDLRHYTVRDYGNRVGVYRMLRVFDALGVRATFAVQGAVAERYPGLVRDIAGDGHEICAHGWDTDSIHHSGLGDEAEAGLIRRTLDALEAAGGRRPTGWISPARGEGFRTPERLAAAGVRWFGDWTHDDRPQAFRTESGPLVSLPLSAELDDWQIIVEYKRPDTEWVTQVTDAARLLGAEAAAHGPAILSLVVRPYVMGQPARIGMLRQSLAEVLGMGARAFTAEQLAPA